MNLPVNPPRAAVIRGISSSPAAAPAAGGGGIPGSGHVHSVGLVGVLAGGVLEAVASAVGVLGSSSSSPVRAFFGASVSSRRLSPCSQSWVAAVRARSTAGSRSGGSRSRNRSCRCWSPAVVLAWRRMEALWSSSFDNFPSVGDHLRSKVWKMQRAARRRHVWFLVGVTVLQKDLCVISIFVGCLFVTSGL